MKRVFTLATSIGLGLATNLAMAQSETPSTSSSTTSTSTVTATTPPPPVTTTTTTTQPTPTDVGTSSTTGGVLATQSGEGAPPVEDVPMSETGSPINRPLLITGVVLLGGTYGASAIDASQNSRPEDHKYLYYPVVGPWMDYANRDCVSRPCNNETGNKALLILDGVGQGLGALSILTSLFIPEKSTSHWLLLGNEKFTTGPTMVGTGYGLGAVGRF